MGFETPKALPDIAIWFPNSLSGATLNSAWGAAATAGQRITLPRVSIVSKEIGVSGITFSISRVSRAVDCG